MTEELKKVFKLTREERAFAKARFDMAVDEFEETMNLTDGLPWCIGCGRRPPARVCAVEGLSADPAGPDAGKVVSHIFEVGDWSPVSMTEEGATKTEWLCPACKAQLRRIQADRIKQERIAAGGSSRSRGGDGLDMIGDPQNGEA
jgi:hypothetical protein